MTNHVICIENVWTGDGLPTILNILWMSIMDVPLNISTYVSKPKNLVIWTFCGIFEIFYKLASIISYEVHTFYDVNSKTPEPFKPNVD